MKLRSIFMRFLTDKTEPVYYSLLDLLRFLAAVSVMTLHYFAGSFKDTASGYGLWFGHGYLGVELFFLISGFVIYNSLKDNWRDYAWSRFVRLYPLFWILCTFTYALSVIYNHLGYIDAPLPFYKYLLNLFIINNGQTANMIDGSYWTLTIEIFFYLYIGLFTYIVGKRNLIYFFGAWLLYTFLAFRFGFHDLLISKLLLVRYSSYFTFGACFALLLENIYSLNKREEPEIKKESLKIRELFIKFFLPVKFMLLSVYLIHFNSNTLNDYASTHIVTNQFNIFNPLALHIMDYIFILFIISIPCSILINKIAKKINLKLVLKILKILGLATYPLYLLHQRVASILISPYSGLGILNIYTLSAAIVMIAFSLYIGVIDADLRRYLKIKFYKNNI